MLKTKSIYFILLAFAALLIAPALAQLAYTGPNRPASVSCAPNQTVAVLTQRKNRTNNSCNVWVAFEIYCTDVAQWQSYPALPFGYYCEDGPQYWIDAATLPTISGGGSPATVSGSVACSEPGADGWCRAGSLAFSASEPQAGYQITDIEGAGLGRLCSINSANGSCNYSPPDGSGSESFWAVSSYGDTSSMSSVSWKFDRTPPTLTVDRSAQPDGDGGWYRLLSPTLTLLASDETSGVESLAYETRSASLTISADGIYNPVASARDRAGNVRVVVGLGARKDSTPPSLTIIAPAADGLNGWYRTAPTLSLTASDATSGIATATFSGGQTALTLSEGARTVNASARDQAGNTTSASRSFQIDSTAPSLSVTVPAPGAGGWYRAATTLTFSASDALSGLASTEYRLDGGAWQVGNALTVSTEGSHTVEARATDLAGNVTTTSNTVQLDTTAPGLALSFSGAQVAGWYNAAATVTLNASDTASGLASTEYRLDGGAWQVGNALTVSTDGNHTLEARATDLAGNISTVSRAFQLDTTRPALNLGISGTPHGGWYNTATSLTLSASDTLSGLASTEYRLDGGSWQAGNTLTVSTDGNHTLEARATDLAGNVSTASRSFQLDTTRPGLSVTLPSAGAGGWYTAAATLSFSGSDALSGLASTEYRLDGGSWQTGSALTVSTDGAHTIDLRATDLAGNVTTTSRTVQVDTVPPTLSVNLSGLPASGWYNAATPIRLVASDTTSGLTSTEYRLDGGVWQVGSSLTVSTDGNHTLEARATDLAGNISTTSHTFRLDATRPTSAFTSPQEGSEIKVFGETSFQGVSSDALSGVQAAEISLDGGDTWKPLTLSASGSWSFDWNTRGASDGRYPILVHASDRAGNVESTARIWVVVGNKPPKVEVQASWWLWEAGEIQIQAHQIEISRATVRITCSPAHPDVILTYSGINLPDELRWDRHCGDGAYAAETGDYPVTVTACDIFGRCTTAAGKIKVPVLALPVSTWTPTPEATATAQPTRTPRATATLPATPTRFVPTATPEPGTPVPTPAPLTQPASPISYFALTAFALGFGLVALADRRPLALRRLKTTLEKIDWSTHD